MKKIAIIVTALTLALVPVIAQSTVAVFDFESDNCTLWGKSLTMSDLLRHELVQIDTVTLVERKEIDKVLTEMDFQMSGWTDASSVKAAGNMLNADSIVTGSVDIFDDTLVVMARLIEVETAKVLYSAKMSVDTWQEFNEELPKFAAEVIAKASVPNFFVGKWEGSVPYENGDDFFSIELHDGTKATITVTSYDANGQELTQTASGTWSYDTNFIRINATFRNATISHIKNIKWVSNYRFNGEKNSFNMLLSPYASSDEHMRVTFIKSE